jgi:S1-C subfamily serine protease
MVGQSGVIQFLITKSKLPQLKILAPPGFAHLTQRTVPLGPAYRAEETLVTSHLPYTVHFDGHRTRDLLRGLSRLRSSGDVLDYEAFQSQLRRKHFAWEPPAGEGAALAPHEIYASRKASVVVIGHLFAEGNHTHAAGVALDPQGIVATAYHVVDKPASVVARGVMTHDGRVHAIREILAANRSDDVVLLRIDASDLIAAPLSSGDREGTPVTVIAHPGTNFYSLTQGHISRYWAATYRGRLTVNMGITAEFADGASGGPVFSPAGAVTGLVSSTDALGNQMVRRAAVPVQAIWDLLRPPAEPVDMPDVSDAPERHQRQ